MTNLELIIGNKNYSSWSLRPWLWMKHVNIDFHEVVIPLYQPNSIELLSQKSPSKKVPVLHDGTIVIWESLAIGEYLSEQFPEKKLWPNELAARAKARAVSAEMHGGFHALRSELPMNLHRPPSPISYSQATDRD